MVLLPLVRTATCLPTPPRDSSSTDSLHPSRMSPFLSVSGAGLLLSNVSLIVGTGPLLDFGLLSHDSIRSGEVIVGEISFRTCSSQWPLSKVGWVNTSFSHCSSNDEPTLITHKHFKQDDTFVYTEIDPPLLLTFHLCTFTSMISTEYSAACAHVVALHDITMTECSFKEIEGARSGALFIEGAGDPGNLVIALCSFVNCSAADFGAALIYQYSTLLSIDKCFFKNMTASSPQSSAGALLLQRVKTATISQSVFMDCSVKSTAGDGGAALVFQTKLEMESVQFRGNFAPRGSDVYINCSSDTPPELMDRVSNCFTDNPDTSLNFFGCDVQTEIIQPFGTVTTIASLRLTQTANDAQGQVEVTTKDAVKGTMLLLLDNTQPNNTNSEDPPPATCRIVVVNFLASSTTGTSAVLSFGDSDRLQFQTLYSLIAASISNTLLDVPDPPSSIFTSFAPRVRKIVCQPGTIGEVLVSLEGYKLEVGEYTIHFEGSPSLNLTVTFTDSASTNPSKIYKPVFIHLDPEFEL
ncbi:hypothetical protein BLNAU_12213 [Blattamonas nauphoetae]|uniref:Uncharacterized protein n=1 Tax=Blattamonas nauphoetae TaxID=2049346 RepID=A0ABQ9XNC7_9EUKA|nr:hypothetical protein BLNAU_12213 [Blattamonas nauphoetae]